MPRAEDLKAMSQKRLINILAQILNENNNQSFRKHKFCRSRRRQHVHQLGKCNQPKVMPTSHQKKPQKLATKFNTEWTKTRPWLIYVNNEGMFCTFCQKYNKLPFGRTAWNTSPCVRVRLQSVKGHAQSKEHIDSVRAELNSKYKQPPLNLL